MDPFLTPPEVFVKDYLTSYQQCVFKVSVSSPFGVPAHPG
jgi:hypothetical protein